ncbi:MAG TPA: L,D-transpeptidase/peptidoglycan binding protein [Candidatus Mediterraneibacter norfolkensis]|nr:L,D-transpeptidase/peptidoglycan binding protein [Candidatus Mediterraneibacter norfolkensis]
MTRRRQKIRDKKRKKSGNAGKRVAAVCGVVLGILALAYLGTAFYFRFHFLPNTQINGRDFSAKTAAELDSYLKQQIADYSLTITGREERSDVVKADEIALTYQGNGASEELLKKQNIFLWPAAFFEKEISRAEPGVKYDKNALEEKISSLKAVTEEQSEPVSAAPEFDGSGFVPGREKEGTAVNMDVLKEKVEESIDSMSPELDLNEAGCYKEPKYRAGAPEVKSACDEMNRYCKASITYEMDEPVVVDAKTISGWLTVDDEMKVTFDKDAVKKWLSDFGKKYDTKGKTRSFTTQDGRSAEVTGGTYGWEVDEKTELAALTQSIEKGETVTKEPAYCKNQTAASHGAQDWGTTYVEVDLTRQYMWYIKDGTVAMETNVVTGKPTPDKETPQGVYSILEMKRDKVLTGEIQADGLPEYETPVDYWMRVTWTGIGFHDATWQSSFGGDRYIDHGSHGCINMSLDDAGRLYGMLEMGTPVVMHY